MAYCGGRAQPSSLCPPSHRPTALCFYVVVTSVHMSRGKLSSFKLLSIAKKSHPKGMIPMAGLVQTHHALLDLRASPMGLRFPPASHLLILAVVCLFVCFSP